ncbi:hypothetical protein OG747_08390 [Streptomyces sp. NBC_01384]|uniref:hypothetical protein n=1 Tax=Streptomyces sp. NBC_01384 TaxID=2903847 RepID=UPI003251FB78
MRPLSRLGALAVLLVVVAAAVLLSDASAEPASLATERFAALASDVRAADGYVYDLRDDSGRTMDTAQITQVPDGTYLAVYHTFLGDGRYHAALATSTDLRVWTCRHDFGAGTSQPAPPPTTAADTSLRTKRIRTTTSPYAGTPDSRPCWPEKPPTRTTRGAPFRAAPRAHRTSRPFTTARSNSPATIRRAATPTANSAPRSRTSRPGMPHLTGGWTTPWRPGAPAAISATVRSSNSAARE